MATRESALRASLKALKKQLARRKKAAASANRLVAQTRAKIAKRRKALAASSNPGAVAVKAALGDVGRTERNNRAPWLDAWARKYVGAWMVGQPWCGLACIKWYADAGKALPKDTVSTVAILNRARAGNLYSLVRPESARAGDLVVMDFAPGGPPAQHVGLALGPMRGGVIPTVEGNTSPGNGGSQNNGGGIYRRSRPRGVVACVARPK